MSEGTHSTRRSKVVAVVAAITVLVLGSVFCVSWFYQAVSVLRWHPETSYIAYSSSLCFVVSGLGLLAVIYRFKRIAFSCGLFTMVVGMLVLMRLLVGVPLDIDYLLLKIFVPHSQLSQNMAPNTAVCFILVGLALCLLSRMLYQKWHLALTSLFASVAVGLGIVSVCGYLSGIEPVYHWGFMTQMSVQSAVLMSILGVGLVAQAWTEKIDALGLMPCWICLPFAVMLLTITMALWLGLKVAEDKRISHFVLDALKWQKTEIINRMVVFVQTNERIATRWHYYSQVSHQNEWEYDVQGLIDQFPMLRAMAWVDASNQSRWMIATDNTSQFIHSKWASDLRLREVMSNAKQSESPQFSHVVRLDGDGELVFLFSPLITSGQFYGFLVSIYDVNRLLSEVVGDMAEQGWWVGIWDGSMEIYGDDVVTPAHNLQLMQASDIRLPGLTWQVGVAPTPQLLKRYQSNLPNGVLVSGVLLTGLLVWGVRMAQELQVNAVQMAEQAKALEVSNQSLKEFAHIAAHEFNTPLTVIKTAVENLNDAIFGELNAGQKEMARMISKNAEMLHHITTNLLHLAKLQAGQAQLERRDVNVMQVTDDVLATLKFIAEKRKIELNNQSSQELSPVSANPEVVTEVLNNLITNALRYARQSVSVAAKDDGDCVVVSVQDDGPGIPKQSLDFMFEKFVQLGEHRKSTAYYGSGLGLAICRELVSRCGGKIWAESEEGKGAVFSFTLPKSGSLHS